MADYDEKFPTTESLMRALEKIHEIKGAVNAATMLVDAGHAAAAELILDWVQRLNKEPTP